MIKVQNIATRDIPVNQLKPGEFARIVKWPSVLYIGAVVIRYKDSLIALGEQEGASWATLFGKGNVINPNDFRVEVLPAGTVLVIE